nr:hypothetical protein [uncultured Trichococcus sp.]
MEAKNRGIELEESVKGKLLKIGVTFDVLQDKDKAYLLAIENAVLDSIQIQKQLRNKLKKNKISLIDIAARTGISRQTLYNNPILKEYININEKEFDRIDIIAREYRYQDEIHKLNEIIETMIIRDCVIEEQKIIINDLKKKLKQTNDNVIHLTDRLNNR